MYGHDGGGIYADGAVEAQAIHGAGIGGGVRDDAPEAKGAVDVPTAGYVDGGVVAKVHA